MHGRGTIRFSEFRGSAKLENQPGLRRVIAYSAFHATDGRHVAVCLFGSMDNFIDFLSVAPQPGFEKWSFSSSPAVADFIAGDGKIRPQDMSEEHIAIEAVKLALDDRDVADGEGGAWRRQPFTFAELKDYGQWLAQVYHVAVFEQPVLVYRNMPELKFDAIVVGAPLWIGGPLRSIRLQDEYTEEELDEEVEVRNTTMSRIMYWRNLLRLSDQSQAKESSAQRPPGWHW
jgi:hypothetical protein